MEEGHADPHESMADAAACGLAAALLLLFSILTASGQSAGTVPAQLQLSVVFSFAKGSPAKGCTLAAKLGDATMCELDPSGFLRPGESVFAANPDMPEVNACRNLFQDQPALFGTALGRKPAITFRADPLGGTGPGSPPVKHWATRLSIQFAKKPRDVELVWTFGPGFVVESVRAELVPATAKANEAQPLAEVLKLSGGTRVRILAGTSTLAVTEF